MNPVSGYPLSWEGGAEKEAEHVGRVKILSSCSLLCCVCASCSQLPFSLSPRLSVLVYVKVQPV